MSEAKNNPAVLIGDQSFLINFSHEFLKNLDVSPWNRTMGSMDKLYNLERDSLHALFVQGDLTYSRDNLICWIRALGCGGLLCLEATPAVSNADIIEKSLEFLIERVDVPNHNVWIFRKKSLPTPLVLFNNITDAMYAKASPETFWPLLDQLDMREPFEVSSTYIRSRMFHEMNQHYPIKDYWDRFLGLKPSLSMDIFVSLIDLNLGHYASGFQRREMVLKNAHPRRSKTPPSEDILSQRWKGEDLKGKTFVLWTEFGLGDEMMFTQLAYYLKHRGVKEVVVVAQAPIVEILKTHPDIDRVIPEKQVKEELGKFDYWAYPHEFLAYSHLPFEDIPKRIPYLSASDAKIQEFAPHFEKTDKLKVGIVWKGNPTHENDHFRSIHKPEVLKPLFEMENIRWYCLQKECDEKDLALLKEYRIPNIATKFNDFTDTAGALMHLDLLVCVDTSIGHLAGAMNIPTLMLHPYIGDWRWGLSSRDNPWYPSIKAIRNIAPSYDWTTVIKDLQNELALHIKERIIK